MTEHLRAALSDDQDTPPGMDVPGVRSRAARIRRGRWAAGAVATLTAVAIAVPVTLLRPDPAPSAPVAGPPPAAQDLACPAGLPAMPGTATVGPLLPAATPTGGLVCGYGLRGDGTGPLTSVLRLTPAEVGTLAGVLAAATPPDPGMICTAEAATPFGLSFLADGRVTALRVTPAGCAAVTDGRVVGHVGGSKGLLRTFQARAAEAAACPATLGDRGAVLSAPAGDSLVPADTERLLLCRYTAGERVSRSPGAGGTPAPDAVVAAAAWTDRLNGAPSAVGTTCTRELGDQLVIVAVGPSATERVLAELGGCRWLTDGTHSVRDEAAVRELWRLAQG